MWMLLCRVLSSTSRRNITSGRTFSSSFISTTPNRATTPRSNSTSTDLSVVFRASLISHPVSQSINQSITHTNMYTYIQITLKIQLKQQQQPFNADYRWTGTRKVKPNMDFTEARDTEWQWHQLDLTPDTRKFRRMFVCSWMTFLLSNQHCQITEGSWTYW